MLEEEAPMRAAVLRQIGMPMAIEEVTLADPKPGEALVRIVATGVCHSDYHVIKGEWASPLPIVLGHEASGVVEAVAEGVTQARPGDHVVLSFSPNCGQCVYCTAGRPHLCSGYRHVPRGGLLDGTSRLSRGEETIYTFGRMSSFAEYAVVPGQSLIPIRRDAPLDKAALVGCAAMTGVGAALNTARIEPGSTVMVVGCGGVGLNCIQGARLASAARIIAVDVADDKLAFARRFGATDVVNSRRDDPVAVARDLTDGLGVDYALEAIGLKTTIEQCYHAVRRGGVAVVVGMAPDGVEASIPARTIAGDEKTLKGCFYGSTRARIDMPRLIDFYMDGRLLLDELVTRTYPLEQINAAFDDLGRGGVGRGLLLPHGGS
jgi:S-(hydroxymethyl)glutathione dehydrogenase/alcohol dehydrogenase